LNASSKFDISSCPLYAIIPVLGFAGFLNVSNKSLNLFKYSFFTFLLVD